MWATRSSSWVCSFPLCVGLVEELLFRQVPLYPTEEETGRKPMPFSRNTIFTISLFALSSLFTWISKVNYFSEMFLENNTCFCPQGNWASQKKKEKNKKECFLWATHHTPGYTHQWEFIPSYQVSSIKYRSLPQWFHLNQYALFINIKLLRRISSKSLLKLTFHISKWVIHILST